MKKLLICSVLTAMGLSLMAPQAQALRDLSLKQQGELPRDQYIDLINPERVFVDKLVVQFVEDTRIRLRGSGLVSLEGRSLSAVETFLKAHPEIKVERLFTSMGEEELDAYVERGESLSGWDVADLNNFYLFQIDGRNADPKQLLQELLTLDLVQTGYYEPIAEPAVCGVDPAPATPNYVASQDYREAAPTGVNIQYAWSHNPSVGNGVGSYWFQDLEWGWCEGHEDFASLSIRNPPDSGVAGDYNHGTAVVSIVGSCDDAKGVTGLVPDVHLTARVVSNHASTADALIAIGGDLLTGETYLIEMHAGGPSQGTVCVCNCGQFEYIAMEYWAANFNAILANSTNGKYCIEAAGNGSMDLDWAGYGGAFNLGVRDSQAIVVGAGTSGAVHNPECWTNHGSRISAQGWGDSVYAAGYGDLFNQASCEQDYTSSFSGTSSASPIVAGAAISLALIHNAQEGSYPSPTLLRSRLTTNGTPQGPTDPWKEINVLPNMKGILAPDLAPYSPGWPLEIIPSDVVGTNVLPANLLPAPAATYVDWAWVNWSRYGATGAYQNHILRDDVMVAFNNMGSHPVYWYFDSADINLPTRGGLHYLRLLCDQSGAVDESVESNNQVTHGFRWDPIVLASDVPATYTRGPKRFPTGATSTALDGFGNGGGFGGWWDVTAVMPQTGADYDIYMYNVDPTPTNGWTTTVATSGGVSTVDFVGCNNNVIGDGDFVGVINWADSNESYTVERQASVGIGSPPAVPTLIATNQLAAGEILDVYEMNVTALTPIRFALDITSGNADVAIFIFGPSSTYFGRSGALWTLNNAGDGGDEIGVFTPPATGWHGIVVCKNLVTDLADAAAYSFYWGPPAGDLTHLALTGWTAPVVARNSGGTVGVLPAILNEGASVGDAGLTNIGSGTMTAGSNLAFFLDGPFVYSSGDFAALASGYTGSISNRNIGTVKGGRHELGSVLDYLAEVGEELPGGESNNAHFAQYAWAPYVLANATPLSRTAAPNWRNFNNPNSGLLPGFNQDGYRLATNYWTGVAAMPTVSTEQLNTWAYNDESTSPTAALINTVESHFPGPGEISFMMANGNVLGNGVNRNVGVTNNFAYPNVVPSTPYTVQLSQRITDLGVGSVTSGTLLGSATTGGQILHTYDVSLTAGQSVPVHLFNNSTVDLGVAIFTAGQNFAGLNDAAAIFNSTGAGQDEVGVFTASVSGWYGVVVYRSAYNDLGPAAPYGIVLGAWAPQRITDLVISMTETDGSDNFLGFSLQWGDITQDTAGNPLVVDHYTCYWSFEAFDNSWAAFASPVVSEVLNQSAFIGIQPDIYFMVTAVDENGMLVASSAPVHRSMIGDSTLGGPLVRSVPGQPAGTAPVETSPGN